jgi:hypothetical protein
MHTVSRADNRDHYRRRTPLYRRRVNIGNLSRLSSMALVNVPAPSASTRWNSANTTSNHSGGVWMTEYHATIPPSAPSVRSRAVSEPYIETQVRVGPAGHSDHLRREVETAWPRARCATARHSRRPRCRRRPGCRPGRRVRSLRVRSRSTRDPSRWRGAPNHITCGAPGRECACRVRSSMARVRPPRRRRHFGPNPSQWARVIGGFEDHDG